MIMGPNHPSFSGLATSYFDEAVQVIHLEWENQNDFASAIAEMLKTLFAADAAFVGSTNVRTGIRESIVNNLLTDLDLASATWLEKAIERCAVAFEDLSDEERMSIRPELAEGWNKGNPYTVLSRAFTLGNKLGALIPIWNHGVLVDFFVSLSGESQSLPIYADFLNRLIPHLEIAVARIWNRDQPPSLERLLKRLRHIGLTVREVEALWWLLRGKTNPEIATIMGVSVQTVKNHLGSAYPKLGVENRAAAFVQLSALVGDH